MVFRQVTPCNWVIRIDDSEEPATCIFWDVTACILVVRATVACVSPIVKLRAMRLLRNLGTYVPDSTTLHTSRS